MTIDITDAITALVKKSKSTMDSADALRFTQSALNLAHAKTVLENLHNQTPPK